MSDISSAQVRPFNLDEVIEDISTLTALLTVEAERLKSMRINDLEPLQSPKAKLLARVERYQAAFKDNPKLKFAFSEREKLELRKVLDTFGKVAEESEIRLYAAREANRQVMEVFRQAVESASFVPLYDNDGGRGGRDNSLVFSLNETV